MGKSSKWLKILSVASLVCLGAITAKADTFSATAVTPSGGNLGGAEFTANVYFLDNNPASNPFGLTGSNCGSPAPAASTCNGNPFSAHGFTIGAFPGQAATVIFGDSATPGFDLLGSTLDGVAITGATSLFTGPDSSPTMTVGSSVFYTSGTYFDNGACNGNSGGLCSGPSDTVKLTYVEDVSGLAVFTLTDTSFDYVFSIPTNTPEPSSLLMLGSGVLGLLGMGIRRKVKA
jgi:hypothetical protein